MAYSPGQRGAKGSPWKPNGRGYSRASPKLTSHQVKEAIRRRDAGEPMRDIARTYNVSHSTISRIGYRTA